MNTLTVSEVARQLNVRPLDVTLLLYHRLLPDKSCPVQNGRRRIPHDLIPQIEALLRERGAFIIAGIASERAFMLCRISGPLWAT